MISLETYCRLTSGVYPRKTEFMLPLVKSPRYNHPPPTVKLVEINQVSFIFLFLLQSINYVSQSFKGILMAIHLYRHSISSASDFSSSSQPGNIRVLAAYENGSVVLREYTRTSKEKSVEGHGWDVIWKARLHNETSYGSITNHHLA